MLVTFLCQWKNATAGLAVSGSRGLKPGTGPDGPAIGGMTRKRIRRSLPGGERANPGSAPHIGRGRGSTGHPARGTVGGGSRSGAGARPGQVSRDMETSRMTQQSSPRGGGAAGGDGAAAPGGKPDGRKQNGRAGAEPQQMEGRAAEKAKGPKPQEGKPPFTSKKNGNPSPREHHEEAKIRVGSRVTAQRS